MKRIILFFAVLLVRPALGQAIPERGLTFKGTCDGNQAAYDHTVYPSGKAIKCDSFTVLQVKGHTLVVFTLAESPVLVFGGDLVTTATGIAQPFDPYMGPITSAFTIVGVDWKDGSPMAHVQAPPQMGNDMAGRGCYFHFTQGQDWNQLTEVECQLVLGSSSADSAFHRATVTFKTGRKFTVDGEQISVEFGTHGANSFRTEFNQMQINGTCGMGIYQTADGALKHAEPGSAIERLFQTVCYKSK